MALETPPVTSGPGDLPPGGRPPRRWPWGIALVVLALAAGAIAFVVTEPSEDKVVESTTATTAATVSDGVLIKAYEDAFAATEAIATNPKVSLNDPSLERAITEPLLSFARRQFADVRAQGIVYEPGGISHAGTHVVEKGADRAVLRSCLIEKGYALQNGERRPAPGPPGKRTPMEAIAVRDGATDTWKISSRFPKDGGRECDGV